MHTPAKFKGRASGRVRLIHLADILSHGVKIDACSDKPNSADRPHRVLKYESIAAIKNWHGISRFQSCFFFFKN